MGRGRWLGGAVAAAGLAVILLATLTPSSGADTGTIQWCVLCGEFGLADAVANLLLFAPLGLGLAAWGVRSRKVVLLACLLSIGIELLQLGIPGRETALGDVIFNTLGAAAGAAIGTWLPARRRAAGVAWALAGASLAAIAAAALALQPAFPRTLYFGQWTPDLGMWGHYGGQVLGAEVSEIPLPDGPLAASPAVRSALQEGAALRVHAVAGPPTDRLSPIFSMADDHQRIILMIGVDGNDLVLDVGRRATDWRLRWPDLRWPGALARVHAGDTIAVGMRGARSGYCLALGTVERCGLAFTVGEAWALAGWIPRLPVVIQGGLALTVMLALGLPIGLLAPRGVAGLLPAIAVMVGATVLPPLLGLATTPVLQMGALALGVAGGWLVPQGGRLEPVGGTPAPRVAQPPRVP